MKRGKTKMDARTQSTRWERMKKSIGFIRQGDVLLVPTNKAIDLPEKGTATLARGEVTGHSHRISNARFRRDENGLATALFLDEPQVLMHEEHDAVTVPAKQAYEVRVQRRANALGEIKRVMD